MPIARRVASVLGEILVTLGAVMLLFVVWQLWWTDFTAISDSSRAVQNLQAEFTAPTAGTQLPGQAFAVVRIPRFGPDYARPVYRGTGPEVLRRGLGHYERSAEPGAVGNFALAGHRTTWGRPLNQVDRLVDGDVILVQTRVSWFVYRVSERRIVTPDQTWVLAPDPDRLAEPAIQAILTLTTCHPEYSSRERFVVHAVLQQVFSHDQGVPADLLEVK